MRVGVALPVPLHRLFDYRCTDTIPLPGARVRVSFGQRSLIGVVVAPASACDSEALAARLRPVDAVLDSEPLVPPALLALCHWVVDYYHQPPGEVFAAALPAPLRRGALTERPSEPWFALADPGAAALAGLPLRSRRQRALLQALADGPQPLSALRAQGADRAGLNSLVQRGWLADAQPCALTAPAPPPTPTLSAGPDWSAQQRAAIAALQAASGRYSVQLLDGVTGSGKTEVYLAAAEQALGQGRQVLMLVPEIGLTPQLLDRVRHRLGVTVASYHSGLGDAERMRAWLGARDGSLRVLVGTRSAVFLPLRDPGLLVVDEEHDGSYKQQDGVPYSARDVAIVRARNEQVPVVLGSATPSLESLHNAGQGRYQHLRLTHRAGGARAPRQSLIDVRGMQLTHGLSAPLLAAVDRHLAADGQVLLFINRRGWSPALICHDCGWSAACPNCDARPTLHQHRRELICHHCGTQGPAPSQCPQCESSRLIPLGQGTERIESALAQRYPGVRCERFDSDRLQSPAALESLLNDTREGRVRLLVGTQMLAKGHDFAGLTLVGVVNADQALFSADFRALERLGQLLTQVAGRAGRGEMPGEVLLQTHEPEHPLLKRLLQSGYPALAQALLEERQQYLLPPYSAMALLRADALEPGQGAAFLREAAEALGPAPGVERLGPAPAPMERRAGRYRAQLLLRARQRSALQRALSGWPDRLERLPMARRVRWTLDVDPMELF